jgi:hypothetical protein
MSLNEYVCKKHITQLNKTYKTSYFHEEPENNNHEINLTKMKSNQASFENSVTFRSFSLKISKWGGSIEVNASDFGELFSNLSIYNDMPIRHEIFYEISMRYFFH